MNEEEIEKEGKLGLRKKDLGKGNKFEKMVFDPNAGEYRV
jgi:hypothetical protein